MPGTSVDVCMRHVVRTNSSEFGVSGSRVQKFDAVCMVFTGCYNELRAPCLVVSPASDEASNR